MSATLIVILVAVLLVMALIGLWFRDRNREVAGGVERPALRPRLPDPRPVSPPLPMGPPALLTTADIAWGVFVGLWLFTLTAGVLGIGIVVYVSHHVNVR